MVGDQVRSGNAAGSRWRGRTASCSTASSPIENSPRRSRWVDEDLGDPVVSVDRGLESR